MTKTHPPQFTWARQVPPVHPQGWVKAFPMYPKVQGKRVQQIANQFERQSNTGVLRLHPPVFTTKGAHVKPTNIIALTLSAVLLLAPMLSHAQAAGGGAGAGAGTTGTGSGAGAAAGAGAASTAAVGGITAGTLAIGIAAAAAIGVAVAVASDDNNSGSTTSTAGTSGTSN